jgi:signal transduction histidine kinase
LDVRNTEQLLTVTAELMCDGAAASACMISYRPPEGPPIVACHGTLTDYVRHELVLAESQLSPRQRTPLWHECADIPLLTIPLSIGNTYAGALHIVGPDPALALDDLGLAASLFTSALSRQVATERSERQTMKLLELHLTLYNSINQALLEAATLDGALHTILQVCCASLNCDLGSVWGVDQQQNVLRCIALWQSSALDDSDDVVFNRQAVFPPHVGLAGRVWATGVPIQAADDDKDAALLDALITASSTFRGAFAVPLVAGSTVCGVLGFFSRTAQQLDPRLLTLLATLGNQIGQYLVGKQAEADVLKLTEALRIERERLLRREVEVRTQMARDLHDGPVQQVAVAELNVQYVRRVAERAPEQLPRALDGLGDQLKRATQDLRTVLYELRPLGIAEEGLVVVLHKYVARFHHSDELLIHLDAPTTLRRLPTEAESAVFIIIQEALSNVRKHAAASTAWITLRDDNGALSIEIRDNGRGFDVQATQGNYHQRGSFGLLNMRERAQLIGGSWSIRSQLGQGTTVFIRIPFPAA